MSYFKLFPKVGYDFNRQGVIQNVINIFRHVRPIQNYVDDFSTYVNYSIRNGERPDVVSQRLYGTPDYHWTFFIVNEFLHDGLAVWPMSQENLFDYLETEYNGFAIETRPDIRRNSDGGITEFRDSLSGRFKIGETITGGASEAVGTLTKKDLYNNQLIVQDVTGTFVGDGVGNNREVVVGASSTDSVNTWKVWPYAEAPHHWFEEGTEKITLKGTPSEDFLSLTNGAALQQSNGFKGTLISANSIEVNIAKTSGPDLSLTHAISSVADPSVVMAAANLQGKVVITGNVQVSNANFFSVTDDATLNLILQEGTVASPSYISNRNYLFNVNEERSQIKIVDPKHIEKFAETFESLLNV